MSFKKVGKYGNYLDRLALWLSFEDPVTSYVHTPHYTLNISHKSCYIECYKLNPLLINKTIRQLFKKLTYLLHMKNNKNRTHTPGKIIFFTTYLKEDDKMQNNNLCNKILIWPFFITCLLLKKK